MFYPVSEIKHNVFSVRDLGLTCEANSLEQALDILSDKVENFIEETFRKQRKPIPEPSAPKDHDGILVVPLKLEARIRLWNLLREKHMSTSELDSRHNASSMEAALLASICITRHLKRSDTISALSLILINKLYVDFVQPS